jgi:hypothetical protein
LSAEAEESPLLEAVAWERLVKTQQAEKGLACAVAIEAVARERLGKTQHAEKGLACAVAICEYQRWRFNRL